MGFLNFYRSFRKKSLTQKEIQKPPNIQTRSSIQDETRRIFDKFDTNGDGKISLEEYKQALKVLGGGATTTTTTAEAAKSFRVADADGDGFIDLEEFSKVYSSDVGAKSGDIQAAFRVFDSDGDGKISAEELMEVLKRMGERCSLEGCKRMIRGVDGDGDGLIDMDEFINMMKQSMKN
ncbi:UNVERIFIED_CONTAM: Calmodulin-like protein 30 [Sesamum radiatum]|uniref:Calmodulin-like protein 30 n=1 Tax=Sesamum radiatum TaxID=300843 RepID=A0AAW2VQE6_SESRA